MPIGVGKIPRIGPVGPRLAFQESVPFGGMSLIATTAVVLISSTDGFPRQPDRTQDLHAFRQTVPAVVQVGQPWQLLFQPQRRLLEPEFDIKRADHTALHSYRETFQTVGQPWQLFYPPPPIRLEPEPYRVEPVDQTPLYGRTTPAEVSADGTTWVSVKKPVFIREEEIRRTDHNLLHQFRAPAPVVQQAPWALYYPPAPIRLETPTYEVRPDHTLLHQFREVFQTVGQPWSAFKWRTDVRLEPEWCVGRSDHGLLHQFREVFQTVGQPWRALFTTPPPRLEPEIYSIPKISYAPLYGRTTPVTPATDQPLALLYQPNQVTLYAEEFEVRPPPTQLLVYGRAGPAVVQQTPWALYYPPATVRIEPEWVVGRPDHGAIHRFRTTYQTVGQPWSTFNWRTDVRLEAEWVVGRSDHGLLHQFREVFQTVGQPWALLNPRTNADVRLEPEPYEIPAIDYSALYGRQGIIVNQPWNAYNWQTPPPNTEADFHYDYRSRDFWSDLFPFLITPTTPVIPPEPSAGGGGAGGGGKIWYQGKRKRPTLLDLPNMHLDDILNRVEAEVLYKDIKVGEAAYEATAKAAEALVKPYRKRKAVDWAAIDADAKRVGALFRLWADMKLREKRRKDDDFLMMD